MSNHCIDCDDRELIRQSLAALAPRLKEKSIFLTGANGFFGAWLIEGILHLNRSFNLDVQLYILTRSKSNFYSRFEQFKGATGLHIIEGSVLDYPDAFQSLDYILHAANLPYDGSNDWVEQHIRYAIEGTARVHETAEKYQVESVLITSSGAVYNTNTNQVNAPFEENQIDVDCSQKAIYSACKKLIEQMSLGFYNRCKIPVTIARCFAFSGAHLPLEQFALGSFLLKAQNKETIIIQGDGTPQRSYMYGADLVIWLLTLLVDYSEYSVYNVGSDDAISLQQLAELIAKKENLEVRILSSPESGNAPNCYIPNTAAAKSNFNLTCQVSLRESINKMNKIYDK